MAVFLFFVRVLSWNHPWSKSAWGSLWSYKQKPMRSYNHYLVLIATRFALLGQDVWCQIQNYPCLSTSFNFHLPVLWGSHSTRPLSKEEEEKWDLPSHLCWKWSSMSSVISQWHSTEIVHPSKLLNVLFLLVSWLFFFFFNLFFKSKVTLGWQDQTYDMKKKRQGKSVPRKLKINTHIQDHPWITAHPPHTYTHILCFLRKNFCVEKEQNGGFKHTNWVTFATEGHGRERKKMVNRCDCGSLSHGAFIAGATMPMADDMAKMAYEGCLQLRKQPQCWKPPWDWSGIKEKQVELHHPLCDGPPE